MPTISYLENIIELTDTEYEQIMVQCPKYKYKTQSGYIVIGIDSTLISGPSPSSVQYCGNDPDNACKNQKKKCNNDFDCDGTDFCFCCSNCPTPAPSPLPFQLGTFSKGLLKPVYPNPPGLDKYPNLRWPKYSDTYDSKINTIMIGSYGSIKDAPGSQPWQIQVNASTTPFTQVAPNGAMFWLPRVTQLYDNYYIVIGGEDVTQELDHYKKGLGIAWLDQLIINMPGPEVSKIKGIVFDVEKTGWLTKENAPDVIKDIRNTYSTKYSKWIYIICMETWAPDCKISQEECLNSLSTAYLPKYSEYKAIDPNHFYICPMLYNTNTAYQPKYNFDISSISGVINLFNEYLDWPYDRIFASYSTDALWGPVTSGSSSIDDMLSSAKNIVTELYNYCINNNMPGLIGWPSDLGKDHGNYDRNTVALNYIASLSTPLADEGSCSVPPTIPTYEKKGYCISKPGNNCTWKDGKCVPKQQTLCSSTQKDTCNKATNYNSCKNFAINDHSNNYCYWNVSGDSGFCGCDLDMTFDQKDIYRKLIDGSNNGGVYIHNNGVSIKCSDADDKKIDCGSILASSTEAHGTAEADYGLCINNRQYGKSSSICRSYDNNEKGCALHELSGCLYNSKNNTCNTTKCTKTSNDKKKVFNCRTNLNNLEPNNDNLISNYKIAKFC